MSKSQTEGKKEKDIWTVKNISGCKHKRVEHNSWGWHCLDCWAYIDKDMINNSKIK